MGLQYNYSEITFTLPWSSVRGMFLSNRKLSHINCNEVMKIFMQIVRFITFKVINVYKVRMKLHPYQKPTKSQHTSGVGMKSVWVMLEKSFIGLSKARQSPAGQSPASQSPEGQSPESQSLYFQSPEAKGQSPEC